MENLRPKVHAVFVHVRDLKRAAAWYSELLGLPLDTDEVESPVYTLPLDGETYLTLDDHSNDDAYEHVVTSSPVFNFCAPNVTTAYEQAREDGHEIVDELETNGTFGWFNIADPDGNAVMICGDVK